MRMAVKTKALDLVPQPDFKCLHCGKPEAKHRAFDHGCPIGKNGPFSKVQFYKASEVQTTQSKRAIAQHEEEQRIRADRVAAFLKEKQKVRSMTLEELVTATVEMISEETGLGVRVAQEYEWAKTLFVTTIRGNIDLGYITVAQHEDGKYSVAGTRAGCFMGNHSDRDIGNMLEDKFKELEQRASAEKV